MTTDRQEPATADGRVHELLAAAGHQLAAARDLTEMHTIACDTTLAMLGADVLAGAAVLRAWGKGFLAVSTGGTLSAPGTLTIVPDALSQNALSALSHGQAVDIPGGPAVLGAPSSRALAGQGLVLAPIMLRDGPSYLLAATGTAVDAVRHPLAVLASMATLAQTGHEQGWVDAVIADAHDIVLLLDPDGTVRGANAAVRRILGKDPELLPGTRVADLVHPDDTDRLTRWLATAGAGQLPMLELRCGSETSDNWVDVEAILNVIRDGTALRGVVLSLRDVRERKVLAAERTHRVSHDPLTNLANQAELVERIEQALGKADRTGVSPALLYVDLDNFKVVNDSLGREAGDRLLIIVAERLRRCLRPGDTLARLGGDEFVALIEDDTFAESLAERLLAALGDLVTLRVADVEIHASIGIRAADSSDHDVDQLLRDASLAMSAAKAAGKGTWRRFHPDMYAQLQQQLTIRSDLRQALDPNDFFLHFQPIVAVDSGQIVGFEALIRWQHRRRGLISPDDFIADAEQTDLIIPIGAWVLKTACGVASVLRAAVDYELTMSVNVSPRQLRSDDILEVVRVALKEAALPPSALCLEITESVLAEDASLIERLKALRALGVHLAIDDFGTGFSSYGHLQRLPIDTIKIDRSFVEALGSDQPSPAVAHGIIQMSLAMGLRTVAEGVETAEQQAALQELGCPFAQGFLFSRPVDEATALSLLARPNPSSPQPRAEAGRRAPG